jgi:hypothetical protein
MSSERSFISSPNASNKMSLTSAASRSSFSELSSDDLPGTPVLPDPPSHFHKKFPVNTALRGYVMCMCPCVRVSECVCVCVYAYACVCVL